MSRLNRYKKSVQENRAVEVNTFNKFVSIIAIVTVLVVVFIGLGLNWSDFEIISELREVPDWEIYGLSVGLSDEVLSDPELEELRADREIINLQEFIEYNREDAELNVDKIEGLLSKKYYNSLKEGINSTYFDVTAKIDYSSFIEAADDYLKEAEIIEELYSENIGDYIDMREGYTEDDCGRLKFIQGGFKGETLDYMLKAHDMYEQLVAHYKGIVLPGDDEIAYYYQSEIVANVDYIDDIEVEVTVFGGGALHITEEQVQYAYEKGYLDTIILTEDNKEELKYLELWKDADFYDEAIYNKAYTMMYQYIGESYGSTKVINITGVDNIEDYLQSLGEAQTYDRVPILRKSTYDTFTISGREEGEQVYIVFDVKSCTHREVPELEDVYEDVYKKALENMAKTAVDSEITSRIEE